VCAVRALARQALRKIRGGVRALRLPLIGARAASRTTPSATSGPPGTPWAGPPALPPASPVTVYGSLDDYVRVIDAFTLTRPDLGAVRAYNHAMIDVVDSAVGLADRTLLDVGASPHGFSLERAMAKGALAYLGVGLGMWEPAEVTHGRGVGRLLPAYGEALPLTSESVDAVMSLSTFEHFLDGRAVLREIHRVLRPGEFSL